MVSVLTIRPKNQVTVPGGLLDGVGLKQGDPIEFALTPDGGIGLYRLGHQRRGESLWELATRLAEAIPGLEDVDLELPSREVEVREVEW